MTISPQAVLGCLGPLPNHFPVLRYAALPDCFLGCLTLPPSKTLWDCFEARRPFLSCLEPLRSHVPDTLGAVLKLFQSIWKFTFRVFRPLPICQPTRPGAFYFWAVWCCFRPFWGCFGRGRDLCPAQTCLYETMGKRNCICSLVKVYHV